MGRVGQCRVRWVGSVRSSVSSVPSVSSVARGCRRSRQPPPLVRAGLGHASRSRACTRSRPHRPRPVRRAAHLRAEPGRSVLRAGVRAGAGPAVPDGSVAAIGAGAAVRGARPELRRARRDDAADPVPRRSRGGVGELRCATRRRLRPRSCAASTPGSRWRASGRRRSSSSPAGSRSCGRPRICSTAPTRSSRAATRSTRSSAPGWSRPSACAAPNALLAADPPAVVPPGLDVTTISPVVGDVIRRAGTPPFFMGLAAPVATVRARRLTAPPAEPANDTANETVRTLDHPSRRYLVHLKAPGWNVIGATAPWLPGVAVGHNDRVAWDAARFDADTQDVFVEKLNPSNPHQVEDNGRWVDTTHRHRADRHPRQPEAVHVRKRVHSPRRRSSRRIAPAISRSRCGGAAPSRARPASLRRWRSTAPPRGRSSRPPSRDGRCRRGVSPMPTSTAGAESLAGALLPVRRGWNGALPAPGWTGAFEWTGWQGSGRCGARCGAVAIVSVRARAPRSRRRAAAGACRRRAGRRFAEGAARADRRRDRRVDARRRAAARCVFAHPLAISPAARRRFNIGPLTPSRDAGPPFAIASNPADWDRSTAMNAPGQSGSPDSAHFADFAKRWAAGEHAALVFTDAAVEASAESTLTLTVRVP